MILEEKWQKYLAEQPEHGMGWQNVDIVLTDGTEIKELAVCYGREILGVPFTSEEIKELKISY